MSRWAWFTAGVIAALSGVLFVDYVWGFQERVLAAFDKRYPI